jgi:hypothetical protein
MTNNHCGCHYDYQRQLNCHISGVSVPPSSADLFQHSQTATTNVSRHNKMVYLLLSLIAISLQQQQPPTTNNNNHQRPTATTTNNQRQPPPTTNNNKPPMV